MELTAGNRTYLWQGDWAKLPPNVQLGYTHGVVEDRAGNIYVANQSPHAIAIFNSAGKFLNAWGSEYGPGAHGLTHSIESGKEFLYLANTGLNQVVKTTLTGEVLFTIATPPRPDIYTAEKKFVPTETAIGPDGRIYIADGYGQPWVHIYSPKAEYLSSFGGYGSEPGQLDQPHGISIDARSGTPVVQVANRANRRIDNFSLEGEFLRTAIRARELRFPCTTVHQGKDLYIPDLFCRVSIFDAANTLIGHLGDYVGGATLTSWDQLRSNQFPDLAGYPNIPHDKRQPGKFSSPHGLHVDAAGNIYVVEWINDGRITRLQRVK